MGVYFAAVNYDKKEYFDGGDFEGGIKLSSITHGTFPRGLALLVTFGSWQGDRVAIINDSHNQEEFYEMTREGEDQRAGWKHTLEAKQLWEKYGGDL